MELKYIVMTIIKILISVPAVLLLGSIAVDGAALMGGHIDNKNETSNMEKSYQYEYDFYDNQELPANNNTAQNLPTKPNSTDYVVDYDYASEKPANTIHNSEEIPDPSALVLPGYNLPENIFNKGKPFYLEKDPLTGAVDFNSKTMLKVDEEYEEYSEEDTSPNIYDKSNIDRKDGNAGSHRPSDVNQLIPNFHDFLNLPVKYNSDKYVYPLISSSYANTKIQGNVNKQQYNHKEYTVTTYKPTISPTYYLNTKAQHKENHEQRTSTTKRHVPTMSSTTTRKPTTTRKQTTTITTTTEPTSTTKKQHYTTTTKKPISTSSIVTTKKPTTPSVKDIYLTSKAPNLLNSPMNHPSFNLHAPQPTQKPKINEIYLTTENVNNIYLTTKTPTTSSTHRIMSLFEQLFGDYDDDTTDPPPPKRFDSLPENKNDLENKPDINNYPNAHAGPNVLTGSNMEHETSYEYDEDYDGEVTRHDDDSKTTVNSMKTSTKAANIIRHPTESTTSIPEATSRSTTVVIKASTAKSTTEISSKFNVQNNNRYEMNVTPLRVKTTSTTIATTSKITSLPLGENHITSNNNNNNNNNNNVNNKQSIIVATQNLREQLNSEKVPKPFENPPVGHTLSTGNVHIPPHQDTVSFVVGNHQSMDNQYVGTTHKESPYDHNPFRPLYNPPDQYSKDTVSYTVQVRPEMFKPINYPEVAGSAITIQPLKNSEASLAIGVPVGNNMKQKPGQVVDEKLDINKQVEYTKTTSGNRVVFPEEKHSTYPPNMNKHPPYHRDVLKLHSKPMFHQIPSGNLNPPVKEHQHASKVDRQRPPWDPRPGHFYSGRPEYARPPRRPSASENAYKRIDNLPNILPQFRPSTKMPHSPPHYDNKGYARQPLLDRPSNRPIGFFEKLQPPPPPKNLHNLRKIPALENELKLRPNAVEDRVHHEVRKKPTTDQFAFMYTPPKVIVPKRRSDNEDIEVETLQMIQAKADKKESGKKEEVDVITSKKDNSTDKPVYVVYPVNTPPLKLDVIDTNKKEAVVIGTRAEKPLPPSKIGNDFNYNDNPILNLKERNDAPILKPHPRPPNFPIKSDFPYPLERPDPSILNPAVPETPSNNGNNLDGTDIRFGEESNFFPSNQWSSIGENIKSRVVTAGEGSQNSNQISATLKTYTEKPIAVAYTPTEPHENLDYDKYPMPGYDHPVVPDIRLGAVVDNMDVIRGRPDNEFTVSAIMHTHPQSDLALHKPEPLISNQENHHALPNIEAPSPSIPAHDFQAPFQASMNIDSIRNQGWSVVRNRNTSRSGDPDNDEITTVPFSTSEFDIENFKPTLIGGFKPIYSIPENPVQEKGMEVNEREE